MKNFAILSRHMLAMFALMVVASNVNTCCALFAYQPKIPQKANRFKKFN